MPASTAASGQPRERLLSTALPLRASTSNHLPASGQPASRRSSSAAGDPLLSFLMFSLASPSGPSHLAAMAVPQVPSMAFPDAVRRLQLLDPVRPPTDPPPLTSPGPLPRRRRAHAAPAIFLSYKTKKGNDGLLPRVPEPSSWSSRCHGPSSSLPVQAPPPLVADVARSGRVPPHPPVRALPCCLGL